MKHIRLPLLFSLILVLALAACGGADETPPPAEDVAAAPEATAVPEAVPTDEPQPDPTAVPDPTAEPTKEPTAEPAAAAQPSADGWGESGSGQQSACDHPYWPLREGARWVFDSAGEMMTLEILTVSGDLERAEATMQASFGDDEPAFSYTWECSADGGLVSIDFAGLGMEQAGLEMNMEVTGGDGLFLPPPQRLEPGYSWDTTVASNFSMVLDMGGDEALEMAGVLDSTQINTITSTDPVSFNGAEVPGLTVATQSNMAMTMTMLDAETTTEIPSQGSQVFGRGIGLLQQVTSSEGFDVRMDLVEAYIP